MTPTLAEEKFRQQIPQGLELIFSSSADKFDITV